MSTSFIIFVILAVVIVGIAGYCLGVRVSKLAHQESPEAQNSKSYEECIAENEKAFKYGSFTDARDGESYRTIQIGNQVWMAENLRFKTEDSFAPDDDERNVNKFGRLYTWFSAMNIPSESSDESTAKDMFGENKISDKNYQGIAPEGWHIPSEKEWEQLVKYISEKAKNPGDELRSICFWQNPGSDSFGFFALPAGYRFGNGAYYQFGKRTRFWTKVEYGRGNAFRFGLTEEGTDIEGIYKSDAISIRCVKNA